MGGAAVWVHMKIDPYVVSADVSNTRRATVYISQGKTEEEVRKIKMEKGKKKGRLMAVTSFYGKQETETAEAEEEFNKLAESIDEEDLNIIFTDANAKIGNKSEERKQLQEEGLVVGETGNEETTKNGKLLTEFLLQTQMVMACTMKKRKKEAGKEKGRKGKGREGSGERV